MGQARGGGGQSPAGIRKSRLGGRHGQLAGAHEQMGQRSSSPQGPPIPLLCRGLRYLFKAAARGARSMSLLYHMGMEARPIVPLPYADG